jgi:hypothetical protein
VVRIEHAVNLCLVCFGAMAQALSVASEKLNLNRTSVKC